MSALQKISIAGLARKLVINGFFSEHQVLEILSQAVSQQMTFISYLIKEKIIPFDALAKAIAQEFALPLFNLSSIVPGKIPLQSIREPLIRQHYVLPIAKTDDSITLVIADPTNQTTLDEIKFHTGLKPICHIAPADKLAEIIEKILSAQELAVIGDLTKQEELAQFSNGGIEQKLLSDEIEDAPIVRYVNKVLAEALDKSASDIHFEPYENSFRIRFRIDGILYEMMNAPSSLATRLTARIKIMAQMDIAERRVPQDGRLKINMANNQVIDFRVSTCPTIHGEKVVMRILDTNASILHIEALGFIPEQQDIFQRALKKPQGLILVTGPTGSGKTITLYTALNRLNTAQVNIITVEDPVEIHLLGINQVAINTKAGLTFATALRAFLRQDPDILMVGEMRDLETAEIGIKAAQTGHLVLSTLHTNCAAETLTRLVSMGIANYNVATSASLIIAQRLARRLCDYCRCEQQITDEILVNEGFNPNDLHTFKIYTAVGCEHCTGGYNGRVGIFELLEVTANISEQILQNANVLTIEQLARNYGMCSLRAAALIKVKQGITSLAEINRVTKP